MPFFVNLFLSGILLILILKAKMMTTAILFMAVVFFSFKYSIKTKLFFVSILILLLFTTLNMNTIPVNSKVGILGKIIDKNINFYIIKTEKLFSNNTWKNVKEKLYFSYNKFSTDPFEIGNKIYIIGKIKKDNHFDTEYMANSNKNSIYSLRNFFKKRIEKNFPYNDKNILFSVVFGGLRGKEAEYFKNAGLLHLFAVSGFHVYIIYSILYLIYSYTLLPINYRRLFTIVFLFFYLTITGFSDSATRAVLLLSLIEFNKLVGFNIDSKNLLGLIGVTNLLYNPNVVFSVGFLMSYFAAFSILLIIEYTKNPIFISFAAFLAVLPWSILFFNGFSLLSPLLSIIFVPIVYSLMFFSAVYIIAPLPHMISYIVNDYIGIIKYFLQYINKYIPYITLTGYWSVILYIISFIFLIMFHVFMKKYSIRGGI